MREWLTERRQVITVTPNTTVELVQRLYGDLDGRLAAGRRLLGRPLTLSEKILVAHLDDTHLGDIDIEARSAAGPTWSFGPTG